MNSYLGKARAYLPAIFESSSKYLRLSKLNDQEIERLLYMEGSDACLLFLNNGNIPRAVAQFILEK